MSAYTMKPLAYTWLAVLLAAGMTAGAPPAFGVDGQGNPPPPPPPATPKDTDYTYSYWVCNGQRRCDKRCLKSNPTQCQWLGCAVPRAGDCGYEWYPYGYAMPGDPKYGFPAVTVQKDVDGDGIAEKVPALGTPGTASFLGLAAKGNIVLGDYTDPAFQSRMADTVAAGKSKTAVTQPYVIDSADISLGYRDSVDAQGRPVFNGNYDRKDTDSKFGKEFDNANPNRKYYESSLSKADFQKVVSDSELTSTWPKAKIDAILFTNHALIGFVRSKELAINGAVVARDDALMMVGDNPKLTISHDQRLSGIEAKGLMLPFDLKRPRLLTLQECQQSDCSQ